MKIIVLFFCITISFCTQAQDISYNKKIVDTLSSAAFWGRGYTRSGMQKAALFLKNEFQIIGATPIDGKDFLQQFSYGVNSFPGEMAVSINGKKLVPGIDFIVAPESRGITAGGKLLQTDSTHFVNKKNRIIVSLETKLTWSAEQKAADYTMIQVLKNNITETPKTVEAKIENTEIKNFEAANVCAMFKGTALPDSFIFITAHYDHLGGMGSETFFPGANDNASGVALLLSLAKYYALHPQKYSIGFILFAGEEIGLLGSKFYTEHPLVPLKNISFLTNTDLAGTGGEGITVVNATEFPVAFKIMTDINDTYKYLTSIGARGKAANSDHYWFTEKAVPSFFFYTKGGIAAYHDVFDKAATLPLSEQADLKELLIKFNDKLQGL